MIATMIQSKNVGWHEKASSESVSLQAIVKGRWIFSLARVIKGYWQDILKLRIDVGSNRSFKRQGKAPMKTNSKEQDSRGSIISNLNRGQVKPSRLCIDLQDILNFLIKLTSCALSICFVDILEPTTMHWHPAPWNVMPRWTCLGRALFNAAFAFWCTLAWYSPTILWRSACAITPS